nr:MAG TPA: CI repressor [Caudoviricetes sp.]
MNTRLQEIIKYKTGGRQREFASLCGWSPQYLTKLLRGENFGIRPVLTLLEVLPEINARWLLLGQGDMLEIRKLFSIQREALAHIQAILEIEKYIPFMSPDELHEYEQAVTTGRKPVVSPDTLSSWQRRASEREEELTAKFAAANAKSEKLCKRPTAKK